MNGKRKCDKCERPATVHLTEIVDGAKLEKHLCEVCATQEGLTLQPTMGINQMLEEFISHTQQAKQLGELVCDHCGMSFLEFRQGGLLGCPHDYEAFAAALVPLLERAHEGASEHVGKVPSHAGGDEQRLSQLLRLRAALKDAVVNELYEQAARLRDEIRKLETS
jgi:protein arginine kinase activator